MENSTTFTNRMTVQAYESKHQCKIHVRPHKTKEGIFQYYHSNAEDAKAIGLVSQKAADLLSIEGDSAWDKLMIADCHYIDASGKQQTCKMLMLSNLKMNTKAYPLILEYVEAIKLAEDNLEQLSFLHPVLDDEGRPVMSSGNFAVVFKMKDEQNGKFHALKCFIKDQEGRNEAYKQIADELEFVSSEFIIPIKFFEKELFVATSNSDETEFPVLLMDWVEGVTLDKYVRAHLQDQYSLQLISYQFCRVAAWLMAQPFAHGDLKPDNILVKDDGSLVLVDYDGMFVPAMKGQKAREIGSPDYRHPARTIDDFNESIDDFSLATIAMQLYAIALQPELLTGASGDTLMLCEKDYRDLEKSEIMTELFSLVGNPEFEKLLAIFLLAHSEMSLSKLSFRIFNINKPTKPNVQILLSTEVTEDEITNGVMDEFGGVYSQDGKRLLLFAEDSNITTYSIKPGTKVICDKAFYHNLNHGMSQLANVSIPESVTHIGNDVFVGCWRLDNIDIPSSVTHIGDGAFAGCPALNYIHVSKNNKVYDSRDNCNAIIHTMSNTLVHGCERTIIPNSVTNIGNGAFVGCWRLDNIDIPSSVTHIGDRAFAGCGRLTSIYIPSSVKHIGEKAFSISGLYVIQVNRDNKYYDSRDNCNAIIHTKSNTLVSGCSKTIIPNSVTQIGNKAFAECRDLTSIFIPDSVTLIGDSAFSECDGLTSINIPNSVKHIGNEAFAWCSCLTSIIISDSVTDIGNRAFIACRDLDLTSIPNSVNHIGEEAFSSCGKLKSIFIPSSVTHIGDGAFAKCKSLESIHVSKNNKVYDSRENCNAVIHTASNTLVVGCINTIIPDSVTNIGHEAFAGCKYLTSITIPNAVTHIEHHAFADCESLNSINIPETVTHIGNRAFYNCWRLTHINLPESVTHLGKGVFGCCHNLKEIIIPNGSINKFQKLLLSYQHKFIEKDDWEFKQLKRVTDEDIANGVIDEFGAVYSHDGKRLLKGVDIKSYCIRYGTIIICNHAFINYSHLQLIEIPESVKYIGNLAFKGCDNLNTIIIPNSVTRIGPASFFACKNLERIKIPCSITNINMNTFYECAKLRSIELPNTITSIGKRAFKGCTSLESIEIPNSVTNIGAHSFDDCESLASIIIPLGTYDKFKELFGEDYEAILKEK